MSATANVSVPALRSYCHEVLQAIGMPQGEAELLADTLLWANLRGIDSHGVNRFGTYVRRILGGGIKTPAKMSFVSNKGAVGVLDAGGAAGQIATKFAMDSAQERANQFGIGAIAIRNSNHFGAAGYFTTKAAEAGYIGMIWSGASPRLAPWGSRQRMIGNNPWSIAVPTASGGVIMLDIANSVVALGKIRNALARGEQIPEGWAQDKDGRPTTDPAAAIEGNLMFIGGHKGSGISLMIDLIGPVLASAASGPSVLGLAGVDAKTQNVGHLLMALDPQAFDPEGNYAKRVEEYANVIRKAPPAAGVDQVLMPGDKEIETELARLKDGVSLPRKVYDELAAAGQPYGITLPG